jgi:cation diffusion facilitator family transporter
MPERRETASEAHARFRALAASSIALSAVFLGALLTVYFAFGSVLALGQAADSLLDVFTSGALLLALRVGALPADENHPRGHHRAEPIAALITAVLAGVLAVEVVRSAASALLAQAAPQMHWSIAAAFAAKLAGKAGIFVVAQRSGARSPALRALALDARNDVLVCGLALLGFAAARHGASAWDAYLAIPTGLWIGWAGLRLASENVRMLMGEAAPPERQAALRAIVERMPDVRGSHDWRVRYEGAGFEVSLSISVDACLALRDAHDIGVRVEERLLREEDVVSCTVHLDVDGG